MTAEMRKAAAHSWLLLILAVISSVPLPPLRQQTWLLMRQALRRCLAVQQLQTAKAPWALAAEE
jgi:hypothetical protein